MQSKTFRRLLHALPSSTIRGIASINTEFNTLQPLHGSVEENSEHCSSYTLAELRQLSVNPDVSPELHRKTHNSSIGSTISSLDEALEEITPDQIRQMRILLNKLSTDNLFKLGTQILTSKIPIYSSQDFAKLVFAKRSQSLKALDTYARLCAFVKHDFATNAPEQSEMFIATLQNQCCLHMSELKTPHHKEALGLFKLVSLLYHYHVFQSTTVFDCLKLCLELCNEQSIDLFCSLFQDTSQALAYTNYAQTSELLGQLLQLHTSSKRIQFKIQNFEETKHSLLTAIKRKPYHVELPRNSPKVKFDTSQQTVQQHATGKSILKPTLPILEKDRVRATIKAFELKKDVKGLWKIIKRAGAQRPLYVYEVLEFILVESGQERFCQPLCKFLAEVAPRAVDTALTLAGNRLHSLRSRAPHVSVLFQRVVEELTARGVVCKPPIV